MTASAGGILAGAACALLVTAAWGQHPPLAPEELYERIAPSVWVVLVEAQGGVGQGSAVVVAPRTLVTNCHVLKDARAILVLHEQRKLRAHLQHRDPSRDLCQLEVPGLDAPPVRMASAASLRIGAKVFAIGNPRGLELTISDGLLSGLRRDQDGALEYLQISVPISPGSSGGGLFDVQGRLVGITTAGLRDSQNLNFALPSDWVVDLPARAGGTQVAALEPAVLPPPAANPAVAPPLPSSSPSPSPSPTVTPAPARVDNPMAARPAVASEPVAASAASTHLAPGRVFTYRLTDRLTGSTREVRLRVDTTDGQRVVFNGGARVENLDGEVLSMQGAPSGDADAFLPPGGWLRSGAVAGQQWNARYATRFADPPHRMDLKAHVVGDVLESLGGRPLMVTRIEYRGFIDRGVQQPVRGSYQATAWYAPSLGRLVRFEARFRGDWMAGGVRTHEVLQLVEIR